MDILEGLQRELDQESKSIYILREQYEYQFPPHKHSKGQFVMVKGGIAYLQTKEREYFIPAHHYVWIPEGMMHCIRSNTTDLAILTIFFHQDDVPNAFYNELGIYPVSNLLFEMLIFTRQWKGTILPQTWAYEFLTTIKHLLVESPGKPFSILLPTTQDKRMIEVTTYIQKQLRKPLTLPQIATMFGYSVRNLTRMFQTHLNISFIQYLKMVRMIKAMELLMGVDKSVSDVAYEVGYSSIAAFSNTFLQLVNMRPSEFHKVISVAQR